MKKIMAKKNKNKDNDCNIEDCKTADKIID